MRVSLNETPAGWMFVNAKGQTVRVSETEPRRFATEAEAFGAVTRSGMTFDGKRLAAV